MKYLSNVNIEDIWRERCIALPWEVSQAKKKVVTTNCEKSAEVVVVKKYL